MSKVETELTLYLIGGLGADHRVFKFLKLKTPTVSIEWIKPYNRESLASYAKRISTQVDFTQRFGIVAVSFGGLIAIEISKFEQPEILILISSIQTSDQLPKKYVFLGRTGVLNLIPLALIKPPKFLQGYLFGAENKELLNQIIKDTDPEFIKWALKSMLKWKHLELDEQSIRIHGTNDRLIPIKGDSIKVHGGAYFMIVDKADEISELINGIIHQTN